MDKNKLMDFGGALKALKEGKRVSRIGWNGKGMWLKLQKPDANSLMTHPYIYIEYPKNPEHHMYPNGSRIPWLASQSDALAEDWFIVEDVKKTNDANAKLKEAELQEDLPKPVKDILKAIKELNSDAEVEVHVVRLHS